MALYFEDEVERYAFRAWESLNLEAPVDVGKVSARLGIDMFRQEFVPEIDGLYLLVPGAPPVIAINSSYLKPPGRQRFTAAHEIGHHLLGQKLKASPRTFFLDGLKTRKTLIERSCDRFAALLLMPEALVREWFEELGSNPENRTAIMSERFGVSLWAMRVRLKELGLPYRRWANGRRLSGQS